MIMHSLGVRQAWALVLFGSAVVVALALVTYKTSDTGWMNITYPEREQTRNLLGPSGAWFADMCFSLFGYFALALPLLLGCAGVAQMLGKSSYLKWRLPLAFVVVWCSGTLLCSLHFPNFIPLPVSTGGLLGVQIAKLTLVHVSLEAVTLLAVFLFAWGLSLLLGFSWMWIAETSGTLLLLPLQKIRQGVRSARTPLITPMSTGDALPAEDQVPQQPPAHRSVFSALPAFLRNGIFGRKRKRQQQRSHEPHLGSENQTLFEEVAELGEGDELYADPHPGHHSKRTDIVGHLRKFGAGAGRLSPELQSVVEQLQRDAGHVEDKQDSAATPPHAVKEVVIPDLTPHQQESDQTDEPARLANQAAPVANAPKHPRVVYDQVGESIEFPDLEDDQDWSDFTDLSLDELAPPIPTSATASAIYPDKPELDKDTATAITKAPTTQDAASASQLVQAVQVKKVEYKLPGVDLLSPSQEQDKVEHSTEKLEAMGTKLEQNLLDFGIKAEVNEIHPGPVVTRFEIIPAPGVKVVRITNLVKDIARSMSVLAVRIVEVIPGKSTIGIEIPNSKRAIVRLSQVIGSTTFTAAKARLPLALGYDIQGRPVVVPLEKMPHLLVAGTTGSGKSVGVNAMLVSLLYRLNPEHLRLLLIDPKMLELSIYNGIPHLLAPVITDMKDAANGLGWCVAEMERRYRLMSKMGVRNLEGYNDKIKSAPEPLRDPLQTDQEGDKTLSTLPHIVVIIDEFADMMMIVGKKVEELIARIAQKARAAGIHLILATQRPSVDVITGLIKANVPTRIAFQVSSKIDSRTILDQAGADQLLGNGDMLFLPPGQGVPQRVHGAFIDDEEVHSVVDCWKAQDAPEYIQDITKAPQENTNDEGDSEDTSSGLDELFDEAVNFIYETQRVSISLLQRKFKIGYNRAARIIDSMEEQGMVSPMESNGKREIIPR